jgi:hypothetical protein
MTASMIAADEQPRADAAGRLLSPSLPTERKIFITEAGLSIA